MRVPSRAPWDLAESPFARAVTTAREAGRRLYDLTISNPGQAGLTPEAAPVLAALADPGALAYRPDPRGLCAAREAVCSYYADLGASLDPARIVLTASTSEAYTWLFKILCEPGEAVATPQPSYPLFEFLTTVEGVRALPYRLRFDGAWHLDLSSLDAALAGGARAVLLVQPSNPVGAVPSEAERAALLARCAEAGAALVVDEVFLDYDPRARTFAGEAGCTTFVLSGLSKVCALPGFKAAWVAASGPEADAWLGRLELVADTFLSVSTPVQRALPHLLAGRGEIQRRIGARLRKNRAALRAVRAQGAPWDVVSEGSGWYAVLRVPAVRDDEAWALAALEADVVVHPGGLYDLPGAHLVFSLLPEPDLFAEGVARLADLLRV